jgi:hypothetical protein
MSTRNPDENAEDPRPPVNITYGGIARDVIQAGHVDKIIVGGPTASERRPVGEVPRWRTGSAKGLGVVGMLGLVMVIDQQFEVPPLAVSAVVSVWLFLLGLNRLPGRSPLAQALPHLLVFAVVTGIALTVTTPQSWTGPITLIAAIMITCAMLATPPQDRALALISLAGISLFTAGLVTVSYGLQSHHNGHLVTVPLGCAALFYSAAFLWFRRWVAAHVITMENLRKAKRGWARASAIGIVAGWASIQSARDGALMIAVPAGLAGLSWLVVSAVFLFSERGETLIAGMLFILGGSVTVLGLVAFHQEDFLIGLIAVCAGVALAGGGLMQLTSSGALNGLHGWLRSLVEDPEPRP